MNIEVGVDSGGLAPGAPSPTPLKLLHWREFAMSFPVDYHMHSPNMGASASPGQMAQAVGSRGISEASCARSVGANVDEQA